MSLCQLFLLFRVGVESIIELQDSSCQFVWEEIDEKETTGFNNQRCLYVCGSDVGCRAVPPPAGIGTEMKIWKYMLWRKDHQLSSGVSWCEIRCYGRRSWNKTPI